MIFLLYSGTSALIIYFQHPENTEIKYSYVLADQDFAVVRILKTTITIVDVITLINAHIFHTWS